MGMTETQVVQQWGPLAMKVALEYRGFGHDVEDLAQEARIALVEAARRWDGRGDFGGFAGTVMRRRVRDAIGPVRPRVNGGEKGPSIGLRKPLATTPIDVPNADGLALDERLASDDAGPEDVAVFREALERQPLLRAQVAALFVPSAPTRRGRPKGAKNRAKVAA